MDTILVLCLSVLVLAVLLMLLLLFSLLDELTGCRMSDAIMRAFDKHMEQTHVRKQMQLNRRKYGSTPRRY